MHTKKYQSTCLTATIALAFCMCVPAQAQTDPPRQSSAKAKAHKRTATPKFDHNGSQETTRERERRLYRECKGRPNAGACLGFAS